MNKNHINKLWVIGIFTMFSFLATESRSQNTLLHFWYFDASLPNNIPLTEIDATYSLTALDARLEFVSALEGYPFNSEHPNWRKASMERRNSPTQVNYRPVANNGQPYNADDMRGLQIRQPFTDNSRENTLIFHLPTTGFQNVSFRFAAMNEAAAEQLVIDYSVSSGNPVWTTEGLQSSVFPLGNTFSLFLVDFSVGASNIPDANNNSDFRIRIRFQGQNLQADEGNRVTFNNFSLDGDVMDGTNLPPTVENPINLYKLIAGTESTIDLSSVFSDPENDPLTFTASSSNTAFVTTQISGTSLQLNPQRPGEATITINAEDGSNPAVSTTFRTLIYPEAFVLSQADFVFDAWTNNEPEYSYPANMMFLQSDVSDPDVNYELLFPYYIPHDDYHADDQATIGFPYNNTSRTRITGLGTNGIGFLNTGRNRDLGGALIAVNTENLNELSVNFLAGTLLRNERRYDFRLQYRTDINDDFSDVIFDGSPVIYPAASDGDVTNFRNIEMPSAALGQPYLQIMWRYYLHSGESGPRSFLRLDDIVISRIVSTVEFENNNFRLYASRNIIYVENFTGETAMVNVYNITGQKVMARNITGNGLHSFSGDLNPGMYIVTLRSGNKFHSTKVMLHD